MAEIHVRVTEVTVSAVPEDNINHGVFSVKVSWRGGERYAVERHRQCLGIDGEWDYQVFAPPSDHVNIHNYALHLFGRLNGKPALPDFTDGTGSI